MARFSATEVAMRPPARPSADQAYLRDANLVVNTWFVADDDPILYFNSVARAFAGVLFNALGSWQAKPAQYALSFCRRISVLCVIPDYALYIAIARLFALNPRP